MKKSKEGGIAKPRLMDAKFTFQTQPDANGHYRQFYVRVSRFKGRPVVTFDLHADETTGMLEAVDPSFLEDLKEALNVVEGTRLPEMSEQEG